MTEAIQSRPCSWCHLPVFWLHNDRTGRRAPIDAEATDKGNCSIDLDRGIYHVLRAGEPRLKGRGYHMNHWATCQSSEAQAARAHRGKNRLAQETAATARQKLGVT